MRLYVLLMLGLSLTCKPINALAFACVAQLERPNGDLIEDGFTLFESDKAAALLVLDSGHSNGRGRSLYRLNANTTVLDPIFGRDSEAFRRGYSFQIETVELADGEVFIWIGSNGLRLDSDWRFKEGVAGPYTGLVRKSKVLPGGRTLLVADNGFFVLEPNDTRLTILDNPLNDIDFAHFSEISEGPNGLAFIQTPHGVFVLDARSTKLEELARPEIGVIRDIEVLSNQDVLIGTEIGLFRFENAKISTDAISGSEARQINRIHELENGSAVISAKDGIFILEVGAKSIKAWPNLRTGDVHQIHVLSGARALIFAAYGLFYFTSDTNNPEPLAGPNFSNRPIVRELADGSVLIGTRNRLFLLNIGPVALTELDMPYIGDLHDISVLANYDALITSERGVFLLQRSKNELIQLTKTGRHTISDEFVVLADGRALFSTMGGISVLEVDATKLVPVPGSEIGRVGRFTPLPDGRILISADKGLFVTVSSLKDAKVAIQDLSDIRSRSIVGTPIPTYWAFDHTCAWAAEKLELSVAARRAGKDENKNIERQIFSRALDVVAENRTAKFVANMEIPEKGDWTLQVISSAGGQQIPIGAAITIPIGENTLDQLRRYWHWITSGLVGFYIVGFACLFIVAHRRQWAFRILSDPVWSRIGVWPMFFVRHWPLAQRWVMAPWYKALRKATEANNTYLGVPVSGPKGMKDEASALINRLGTSSRLWLQGRAGMGKTEVFKGWQRAYFRDDASDLAGATRRWDYVLLPLQVREYANLPAEPNQPEYWLVEAVRRCFVQNGLYTNDRELVSAMLRAGGIALALDGMNEADRDDALAAFATSYPQVPIIVTSQSEAVRGFETWHLPQTILDSAKSLLQRWLGTKNGTELWQRMDQEGLLQFMQSGYDLRLIADIAKSNPKIAKLPSSRIDLYRSVLAEAKTESGEALPLDGLRDVAWRMVLEKRRDIGELDINALGGRMLKALETEGVSVVRRFGDVYAFRHDQMRAFLAASWLVEEAPNISAVVKRLDDCPIWRCSRRDQEEVWRFVADLLKSEDDILNLWCFSAEDPDRAFLQAALQSRAKNLNLSPAMARSIT